MSVDYKCEKATNLFRQGYNCAQSVVLAFSNELDLDEKTLAKLASSFGGGMGRLREVCGAVSGMFLVYGMIKGYSQPEDTDGKKKQYKEIQAMAAEFEKHWGSIVCRTILKKPAGSDDYRPEARTERYYICRPCQDCVKTATEILENFLKK